jgi:hypothetical protein
MDVGRYDIVATSPGAVEGLVPLVREIARATTATHADTMTATEKIRRRLQLVREACPPLRGSRLADTARGGA